MNTHLAKYVPKWVRFVVTAVLLLFLLLWALQTPLAARSPQHWGGSVSQPEAQAPAVKSSQSLSNALAAPAALSNVPCTNGMAGPYPCNNVDLLAFVPLNGLIGGTTADIWGWTDSATGKEYAIVSHSTATSFVDVSDPINPSVLGTLPAPVPNILWRDVKVYNNHAYIVGDGDFVLGHGLQIFDLTQLRGLTGPPVIFAQTARFPNVGNTHNIFINEETGFAYLVGSDQCAAGLYMLDLTQNPLAPQIAGCFADDGYTHDVQCVIYSGPDAAHQGREICVAANEDTLTIVDVTDKNAPVQLGRQGYTGSGYTHQGWFTEGQAYFISNDELDEQTFGHNTHSYIWDVRDLENPVLISTYVGPTTAIDHNLYVRDGFVFESNYAAGLRILDAADVANGNLTEIAFFDTHPASDLAQFVGTWSNYPFFESGIVIVSNIEDGLYVLRPNLPETNPPAEPVGGGKVTGGGWINSNEGAKINFHFQVRDTDGIRHGHLDLRDNVADVSIDIDTITAVGSVVGDCGGIVDNPNAIEFWGDGTYNGSAASFRVCAEDNDGTRAVDPDQLYLECLAGCGYSTGDRAPDNGLDGGGQIHLHVAPNSGNASKPNGVAKTNRGMSTLQMAQSSNQASVLMLDPLLLGEAAVGTLQPISVSAYDADGELLSGVAVTLARTLADGSTESWTAVTGMDGLAIVNIAVLSGNAEFIASSGTLTSNAININGLVP